MRKILPVSVTILALLLAGVALHAEEGESELDAAERTIREHELTIRLQTEHLENLEAWNASLGKLIEQQERARGTGRKLLASQARILNRQIEDLRKDLETERSRSGVDKAELGVQLMREQERHVEDVQLLHTELAKANEVSEWNRVEATQSVQREARAQKKIQALRDHVVHAARLLGEIGPAAAAALPWLKETADFDDPVLVEAAQAAAVRIGAGR